MKYDKCNITMQYVGHCPFNVLDVSGIHSGSVFRWVVVIILNDRH